MRLLTYNIHSGRDVNEKLSLRKLAREIQQIKADIIALQEVDSYFWRSRFRHQARYLARFLKMNFVFGVNMRYFWVMRYGNAILSRYPILAYHNYPLLSFKEKRGLLLALIACPKQKIIFLNTHLGLSSRERAFQVKEILHLATALNLPFILAGDLNASFAAKELKPLLSCFQPAKPVVHNNCATFPANQPQFCLDYILLSKDWEVNTTFILPAEGSDHLPVIANVGLNIVSS
ncbi:hypothetical protein HY02_04755 [Peptococcaceae bacterium SCADC1_2_3]|nr:hypothetical protein DK28_0209530 [Peptococcaceae bacterium SCADC1_2_3]KFI37641.1 hypothetical protein HY02_04755 [Peptococcaceae bacterium SCADC1_2_3]